MCTFIIKLFHGTTMLHVLRQSMTQKAKTKSKRQLK